jgi:hypothetical protein
MRRYVGLFLVFTVLLTFGNMANAANVSGTWSGAIDNNWSNAGNWSALPEGTGTATIGDNGTVLLDTSQSVGIVLLGSGTVGNAVLNITNGSNLIINKGSSESFGLARIAAGTATVNHSAGTVTVGNGSGTAETRLNGIAGATGTYNLSGTGILDTEVLSKGNSSRSGVWNADGGTGTLVVRNMIYRFGLQSAGLGFVQDDCILEIGAINTVKAITVGNGTNSDDYTVDAGGTMVFDIASASSYDTILQYGNVANVQGAALTVRLGYAAIAGATFDVWTFNTKSATSDNGSGAFASITAGWSAAWVDTNADTFNDTLRLTYIPEPATIALLGLGFLALKRNKK